MADYSLAQAAYDDLEQIDEYTLQTWGDEQRTRYLSDLFQQFDLIAENPSLGKLRPELADGVQSLPLREHVIFYEVHAGRCHILRVLHHSRDLNTVFP